MVTDMAERFWEKVDKSRECWLWTGAVGGHGYGNFLVSKSPPKWDYAHRVAWALTNGPLPRDAVLCHTHESKLCVRPDHLYIGTDATNRTDAYERGKAEATDGRMKALTEEQKEEIIHRYYSTDVSQTELAREFKVAQTYISYLTRKRVSTTIKP